MKKLLIILFSSLFLYGCNAEQYETKVVDYQIVHVKKPKRMYVTLKDIITGEQFRVYVSKRCSNWQYVSVGSTVSLATVFYKKDNTFERSIKGTSTLCPH